MEKKEHKDMTSSELLRWAADDKSDKFGNTEVHYKLLSALNGVPYVDSTFETDRNCIRSLADKIDAELTDARADGISEGVDASLRQGAELWAKANGWPDFRDGEDFGAWLDRCTYKKPVDDHNEPVQFGEEIELHHRDGSVDKGRFQEATATDGPVWVLSFTGVDHGHLYRYDSEFDVIKRPVPEVLLGDGNPVSKGETVYVIKSGIERVVKDFGPDSHLDFGDDENALPWVRFDNDSWMYAHDLTHTPPDTQDRINDDTRNDGIAYWGCLEVGCYECPARIDGKTPDERYDTPGDCDRAMVLDLLRRQRELDKRTGGDA